MKFICTSRNSIESNAFNVQNVAIKIVLIGDLSLLYRFLSLPFTSNESHRLVNGEASVENQILCWFTPQSLERSALNIDLWWSDLTVAQAHYIRISYSHNFLTHFISPRCYKTERCFPCAHIHPLGKCWFIILNNLRTIKFYFYGNKLY